MEEGEEYLVLDLLEKKVPFFPNKDKKKETDPDYRTTINLAIWVNKKKEKK